jgi:predicted XRE-type DNA-binding protein
MNEKDKQILDEFKVKVKKGEAFIPVDGLPKDPVETVKVTLCQRFIEYRNADLPNRKVKDLAALVGVSAPQMSEILACKTDRFTIDFLMNKVSRLAEKDQASKMTISRMVLA